MPHKVLIENIKFLKERCGLIAKRFCLKCNVPYRTYTGWIDGLSEPSLDHMENISLKCKVSIDWLCRVDLSLKTRKEIMNNFYEIDKKLTNGK